MLPSDESGADVVGGEFGGGGKRGTVTVVGSELGDLSVEGEGVMVAGDADVAVPLAASERLAQCIPGAQLLRLAGAPHLGNVECAQAFTERVGAFLRETAARP